MIFVTVSGQSDNYEIGFDFSCREDTSAFSSQHSYTLVLKPNQKLKDKLNSLEYGGVTYVDDPYANSASIKFLDSYMFDILDYYAFSNSSFLVMTDDYILYKDNNSYINGERGIPRALNVHTDFIESIQSIMQHDVIKATIGFKVDDSKSSGLFGGIEEKTENIVVRLDKEYSRKSYDDCMRQIKSDRQERYANNSLVILGVLLFLLIAYTLTKIILRKVKSGILKANDKYNSFKIRKIAEEESIRSSVKKSFENSDEDDIKSLQDLINKAVSDGDTQTAKALLKILNSKKNKSENEK